VLRARESVDAYFLLSVLLSDELGKQIESHAVGSNYPAINSSDIRRLQVPAFDSKTQRAIGKVLATIDTAIEQTEALIEKYQHIKAGLMHDLFTRGVLPNGQLRPPREQAPELYQETAIGWIPREWHFTTCEVVCEQIIDCKNRTPPETPDGHPAIRTPNVRNGEFVDKDLLFTDARSYAIWTARGKPKVGDVVITREAPVGEVCMIPERHPEACLGQRMMLYRPNKDVIDPSFFLFALQSRQIQNRLDLISGGSTVGHVRVGDIRSLWMFMPKSKQEQQQIAKTLSQASERLRAEQTQKDKLRTQKLGLMQDLLTGKVAVTVDTQGTEMT
jgi:type I restriction enzyme S subunit